ncbi:hypothetical protein E8E14_004176 [Neopestalotiopsis sp. 37M]|nr:hypothetical protein E8E14_004176 [Neopestalotiopsis sp. 37M]
MDRRGEADNAFAAIKGSWSSQFNIRKDPKIYEQENQSHMQQDSSNEDDIVEFFMEELSNSVSNSHRNDLVTEFFRDTNLEKLENSTTDACSRPNSLLDDRKPKGYGNIDEDGGYPRKQKGPMSPRELFIELRKPRYTPTTSAAGTYEVGRTDEVEHDAERRIVYIADAHPWSILAIITTASTNQALAVRDFIYKYLDFQALFGVSIHTDAARYALEVHLPYYAWRKGSMPNKDPRKDGSARPLRKVRCVPFLQGEIYSDDHSSCIEHIYQAQLSFLVSGVDNMSWVGYCFVDTYHDGVDSEDAVQNYAATSPDEIHMDPASGGNFPASPPFWSPRVYFLQVLQFRIGMIKAEWTNVVSMIQSRVEPHVSLSHFSN